MKHFLTAIAMAATVTATAGDLLTPETLWDMNRMGGVTASADGRHMAYTLTHYNVEKNAGHTTIHVIAPDGSDHRCLTTGRSSESSPAYLPDGRLAYLSKGRLYVMTEYGKNRQPLTPDGEEFEAFKFSPDGKQVLLVKQVPYTASIAPKEADLPLASGMVINDLNYKHWDQYVTTIPHLFIASVSNGKVGELTDILDGQPYECPMLPFGGDEQFCWSPDGKYVAYTCRKKIGVDYATSTDSDIYLYDVATGKTSNLCKTDERESVYYSKEQYDKCYQADFSLEQHEVNRFPHKNHPGYDTNPQFSPDGSKLAWLSRDRDGYEADLQRICVMDMKTTGTADAPCVYVTDSFESEVDEFVWADNNNLFFIGVWQGRMHVYRTDMKGNVLQLTTGNYDYTGLTLAGDQLYAKRHSMAAPDDLYHIGNNKMLLASSEQRHLMDAAFSQPTAVTHVNAEILDKLDFGEVRERIVKTQDGHDMLCWVIYPPHFDASKKYPTLLFCEGGPQSPVSQFWSYRWNFQIMAANGYIIIAPNRRGLPGFGKQWLEEISGNYTGRCMQDYKDAIDDLAKEPYVDSERLGCVGASFGGFSTYWLAGNHEGRFKCFIAHDGIFNTTAQYTETEERWFENWDAGGAFWRVPQNTYYTQSPHLYVDKWDSPILCIHGEKDYRILASQGQSAFMAARLRGLPAQLLLYPDENHWVLKPQNGILWQRTFFRWLDRWLKQ